ncbi:hydrogenase maturation protease [Hoyosella subflava]|uniref:Nickel/iron hydrogenase maturation factor, HyaD n=1 Tax=Hoyosella subflava (strain DSM 45089 / JCM 17490 / NBRC 109087 / DQS3-9A1) TaxID=443218 RepID=F6ENF7_HOYSD|nr:hydrogenase maturation protease [Hoyosella subflava]AEF40428.1 nickel/iron hydrogenase maturation factor, HyaD [Hoyosella subflava DQS3-9A1]
MTDDAAAPGGPELPEAPGAPTPTRVLVAGIGNIFLGDDGFGPAVLRALNGGSIAVPPSVRCVDYGIRGMHLAYDLLEKWGGLILVDALPGRGAPGTVHVLEVDARDIIELRSTEVPRNAAQIDGHAMDPAAVFASLDALGGSLPRTLVVGCEADTTAEGIGLSPAVEAAVPVAARRIAELVATLEPAGAGKEG